MNKSIELFKRFGEKLEKPNQINKCKCEGIGRVYEGGTSE